MNPEELERKFNELVKELQASLEREIDATRRGDFSDMKISHAESLQFALDLSYWIYAFREQIAFK